MKQKNGNRCPFRPESAVSTCFGGHFDRIDSRFCWNQREFGQVGANKKKKKGGESASRTLDTASGHVGLRCGNLGAALVLSSAWFKLAFCGSLCIHVRYFVEAIRPFLS